MEDLKLQWQGVPALKQFLVELNALELDPQNARKHTDADIAQVQRSLDTFGQVTPVVVRQGVIKKGNGTCVAARALGWTHIAALEIDDWKALEAAAYAIADNRTGEKAGWDYQQLSATFQELSSDGFDIGATGWEPFEVEPMMQADWNPPAPDGSTGDDQVRNSKTESNDQKYAKLIAESEDQDHAGRILMELLRELGYNLTADTLGSIT